VPRFPTTAFADAHPELLRLVPRRWRHNRLVLTGLAASCGLVLGARASLADSPEANLRVAPIFTHGDGKASYGCMIVNPPIFLSEDEAREAILAEAKAAGLELRDEPLVLPEVRVPVTDERPAHLRQARERGTPRPRTKVGELRLDATNAERRVSVEFVSYDDFRAWESGESKQPSISSDFDLIGTAGRLREGLAVGGGDGTVGVLYDPAVLFYASREDFGRTDREALMAEAKERARTELRKQVKDFVEWLKAQGVI